MEEGKACLNNLQSAVSNIIEAASRVAHRDSKDGQAVKQTGTWIMQFKPYSYTLLNIGGVLISHILFAKANCGEYDACYGEEDGEAWLYGTADRFLSAAQMLNMARMEGNITDETNRLFLLLVYSSWYAAGPFLTLRSGRIGTTPVGYAVTGQESQEHADCLAAY